MQIKVLYFEGCPTHEATVELVRETVDRLGLDADIAKIHVETDEQARQMKFLGSPSVHIDGVDIEPDAEANMTFGRRCRVYATGDGLSGTPPAKMLEAALRGEPYETPAQSGAETPAQDCCASKQRPRVRLLVADWCPQCPAAKTFWTNLQEEVGFDLDIVDIESEQGMELAAVHGVRSVPSTIVDEQLVFRQTPVPSRVEALEALGSDCC